MLLEVSKDQIKSLKDDELRELIVMLSNATLKKNNISNKAVLHGGNQDSKDGGVDVRIFVPKLNILNDYIDNPNTIIQVKVPNMTSAEIKKEMLKNGKLRESIENLSSLNGKYVIVSSSSDVSDLEYQKRISTMRECIKNKNIEIDYYDSQRIASWVNEYFGIVTWIYEKNGLSIIGWNSFDGWKKNYFDFNNEYIFDNNSFVYKDDYSDEHKISILDAIKELRKKINIPKQVIRIAGLSGVGKTRFVFSLFDERIDINAINHDYLLYCDISNNPDPDPIKMVDYLIKNRIRAIIVVDNCEKDMHLTLAKKSQLPESLISLITVEYDAKVDDIIESSNYYLTASSDEVIRRYLKENFNSIHDANINTITNCSGGNFRLAKYLATSIENNNTIGILNNSELFDRLFMKKNKLDNNLLTTAEICSILFSFNITDELECLSEITDIEYCEIYKNVSILKDMQIIQSRGDMRAVLPHALANKLASDCLKKIKLSDIVDIVKKSNRMFLSFSRRLKYLHTSKEAKEVAKSIINSDDFSQPEFISKEKIEILKNLSYIIPNEVLNKIIFIKYKDFFSRKNKNFDEIVDILINLAYDPNKFEIVCPLLLRFACSEKENENNCSIRNRLYNLFHIYLSGTHATLEQRIKIVDGLIKSDDVKYKDLGFKLLDELLKTKCFLGNYIDFGSKKKDYGYQPKNQLEIKKWYETIVQFCAEKIVDNDNKSIIMDILANNFNGLINVGLIEDIYNIIKQITKDSTWPEMWIAVKSFKHFNKNKIKNELMVILNKIEKVTKPQSLQDKFKVYVVSKKRLYISADDITDNWEYIDSVAYNLGKQFGENIDVFNDNIDLICGSKNYRDFVFGKGLGYNIDNGMKILNILFQKLNIDELNQNINLISGIIFGISSDSNKVSKVMDSILNNERIRTLYPKLQSSYVLKNEDIDRIISSFKYNFPILDYSGVIYRIENINNNKLIEFINKMPNCLESFKFKIMLLHKILFSKKLDSKFSDVGANIISKYPFSKEFSKNDHVNYELSQITKVIFDGQKYTKQAKLIFAKIKEQVKKEYISFYNYEDFLGSLIEKYSIQFLDIFIDNISENYNLRWFFNSTFHKKPLSYINDKQMIDWMELNGKINEIIELVEPFNYDKNNDKFIWSDLGLYFIDKANNEDNSEILIKLIDTIYPSSWDETLPDLLRKRIPLLDDLIANIKINFRDEIILEKSKLLQRIDVEEERFSIERRNMFNTFE